MDSGHRHELKTNELANLISHSGEFIRKNYMQITGVVLIIVAIGLWGPVRGFRNRAKLRAQAQAFEVIEQLHQSKIGALQSQAQNMGISNALLVSANALEMEARKAKNPLLGALALIKRGEALRSDLHFRISDVEPAEIKSYIEQARKAYNSAIEKAKGNPGGMVLEAMANFGLGLCAEELGDLKQAKSIYESIVSQADYEGTVFPSQAQLRLESMDDSRGNFVFVSEPVPSEIALPEILQGTLPDQASPVLSEPAEIITPEPETN